MADATSTVELIFQGVDRTSEATQAALGNVQKFSGAVQSVTAPMAEFTTKALKLEAALLTAGAAVVGFSIKVASDFDAAFREISTLIDRPIEDLGGFRDAILDYARDSSFGMEQVTSAVYSAISAGIDYTDSLEVVAKAEQLAVAGKADLKDALIALEGPINAYGASAEDAADFSDALFQAVRDGITTLPELSSSLSRVTGLAANAGIEFGELLAAVSALTATGTPTAEAVTQIRAAISNIISPSQQASAFAAELGLEFNAAALQTRGFAGVLQDAADATGGNIDELAKLFGSVQALGGVLTLTGVAAESFADALEGQANRAGVTAEAFSKMADAIQLSNQRVANALRGVAIEIGDPLLQSYGGVADAIAAVFNAVGANVRSGQLGGLVEYLQTVLADTEAVFRNIARNLPAALEQADLSGFIRNIDAVRDGISKALGGLELDTAEGLARAITLISDAFGQLGNFVGGAIGSFETIISAAVRVSEAIVGMDDRVFKLAGTFGGFAIQAQAVLPALDTLLLILIAARGGGLAKAAGVAATTVGTLAAALGTAGLVGAAGAGGFALGTVLADGLDRVIDRTTGSGSLGGLIYDLVNGTEDWTSTTIAAASAQGDLAQEMDKTGSAVEKVVRDYDALVAEATLAADINEDLAASFAQIGLEWDAATGQFRSGTREIERATDATEQAEGSTRKWIESIVDGVPTFTQAAGTISDGFGKTGDAAEDAEKKSESFLLRLEELAANERIRAMELRVDLDIAQIEADTRRVEAAFDSINTTINSTGTAITDLFGIWSQVDRFDQSTIMNQIEIENRRRQEALELQTRLTEAQIRALDARTAALARGDMMIRVDGTGLEPELEAFMWRILSRVRTRVNAEFADFLLGVEA